MSTLLIPFSVYKKIGAYIPSVVSEFCKDQDFYVQIEYKTLDKPDVKLVVNGGFVNTEIGYIPFEKDKIHEKLREAKKERYFRSSLPFGPKVPWSLHIVSTATPRIF